MPNKGMRIKTLAQILLNNKREILNKDFIHAAWRVVNLDLGFVYLLDNEKSSKLLGWYYKEVKEKGCLEEQFNNIIGSMVDDFQDTFESIISLGRIVDADKILQTSPLKPLHDYMVERMREDGIEITIYGHL